MLRIPDTPAGRAFVDVVLTIARENGWYTDVGAAPAARGEDAGSPVPASSEPRCDLGGAANHTASFYPLVDRAPTSTAFSTPV